MRERLKKLCAIIKGADYRHYICIAIFISFVVVAACVFPHAGTRIVEGFRDIFNSLKFYFSQLFGIEAHGQITVMQRSVVPFVMPFNLPSTWDGFKAAFKEYWHLFFTSENFFGYMGALGEVMYYISKILLVVMPLLLLFMVVKLFYGGKQNNDYDKDSRMLKGFKKYERKVWLPVKAWFKSFGAFVGSHKIYVVLWCLVWAWNFNFLAIILEFFAFYFYFASSFHFSDIYFQLFKLFLDLTPMLNFIPTIGWIVILCLILNVVRRRIGHSRLEHMENKDRGFINERPIVLMLCGTMGKKKTTVITDMALSQEVMFRDKAFEKILENDLKFPFFPWINLENAIKKAIEHHTVYNLATCRRFAQSKRKKFEKRPRRSNIFMYDYKRYGMTYDDNLTIADVWSVIEVYTQLYFIYVMESSLLISNYSIRTDVVIDDVGNFPLWDNDFFARDSRLMQAYSRHAHILDFGTLRLGRKMVEDNKFADSFEFGVICITEIGKERGNMLENKGKKKTDDEANQLNDLFNAWLKMVRHSATVDNFPFVKVLTDEQRPESWGSDAKDLCEIVYIDDCGEMKLSMPLFALSDLIINWCIGKFSKWYYERRHDRGDNTLPMYLLRGAIGLLKKYQTHIYNTFGYYKLNVLVEAGTQDGEAKKGNYYLMAKKIYSKRFSTDCFSDFFNEKALRSPVGLADLPSFGAVKATFDEMKAENSYFFNDLSKIRKKEDEE